MNPSKNPIPLPSYLSGLRARVAAVLVLLLVALVPGLPANAAPGSLPSQRRTNSAAHTRNAASPQAIPAVSQSLATLLNTEIFSAFTGQYPNSDLAIDASGNVYGTTFEGGAFNGGTVFKVAPGGAITVLHNFGSSINSLDVSADGDTPEAGVLLAPDGFLYGTTTEGGANNFGTLYRVDPTTGALATLANFDYVSNGAYCESALVTDGSGNFYGTSTNGGTYGDGVLFSFSTASGTITPLFDLDYDTTGDDTLAPLLLAPDGNLYGTATDGGSNGYGTAFQFNLTTAAFTVLLNFDSGTYGAYPESKLVTDGMGNFFGTAEAGGSEGYGTVFELAVTDTPTPSATATILYVFGNTDAYYPDAGVIFGGDGNLYGTTYDGGDDDDGTVFQLVLNDADGLGDPTTLNILYSFTDGADGYGPYSALVTNAAGVLVGVDNGGLGNSGTIFELTPGGAPAAQGGIGAQVAYTFGTLYSFLAPNGLYPEGALTLGSDGNFYGTTFDGGPENAGTVFVYDPTTGATTTLYVFYGANQSVDGSQPVGQLVQAGPGVFYGTTEYGGTDGEGTIFQLNTATDPGTGAITGTVTLVNSFTGTATGGEYPVAGLTYFPPDGTYYGTTTESGEGTIFQFNPTAGTTATVATFNGANGSDPEASLLALGDSFYGTTNDGGTYGDGTIFRFTPSAGVLTTLFNFVYEVSGEAPGSALIQGLDGYLYGSTFYGGTNGDGTLFQLNLANNALTTLVNFDFGDGYVPYGALVQAPDGNFYGTTVFGGNTGSGEGDGEVSVQGEDEYDGQGTIFQFNPTTGAFTTLLYFGNASGVSPLSGLTLGANGQLYGTTAGYDEDDDGPDTSKEGQSSEVRTRSAHTAVAKAGAKTSRTSVNPAFKARSAAAKSRTASRLSKAAVKKALVAATTPIGASAADDGYGTIFELFVAPAITSGQFASGTVGTAFSFQLSGTFSPTGYTATGLPPGLSVNATTGTITGTPTTAGTYTVAVGVSNPGGTASQTLTILIQTKAPAVTSGAPPNGDVGVAYSYQITAGNSPTSYSASGLPPGLTLNPATGLVSGTPTTPGTYAVVFSATNAGGTNSSGFQLTILPPAPVINSPLVDSAQVGEIYSYQITATNSPSSFAAAGLPAGLSINAATGLISGTPTTAGTYSVALSAGNGQGAGKATLSLNVTGVVVVPTPVVASKNTAKGQIGVVFNYQIAATNNPTSYGATGLPAGLTIGTKTGLITGTPKVAGTFTVSLKATNSTGTGTEALALTIAKAPLPAINVAASVPTVTAGTDQFGEFQLTRTGDISAPLTVTYTVVGTAIPNVDYHKLKGIKKFGAGKSSVGIDVFPEGDLDGDASKTVKLVIKAGDGYILGAKDKAVVTIVAAP